MRNQLQINSIILFIYILEINKKNNIYFINQREFQVLFSLFLVYLCITNEGEKYNTQTLYW